MLILPNIAALSDKQCNQLRAFVARGGSIVTAFETSLYDEASLTVHLVNLTNPMMMKGPFRELMPVGGQVVRVKLSKGAEVRGGRLLCADQERAVEQDCGYVTVAVSGVLDHEVVAIDL